MCLNRSPIDLPTFMTRRLKHWLVLLTGWGLIVVGVAGLFLPFLQGVLLLLIGLSILSSEYAWARRLLHKLRERFPGISSRLEAAGARARAWLKRIFSPTSGKAQG
ncbi:MAG: PGPGW domain-containing protein [Acidobacteriota bacterium]